MAVQFNDRSACRHSTMAGGIQHHQAARIIGRQEPREILTVLDRWKNDSTTEIPNRMSGPKILGLTAGVPTDSVDRETVALDDEVEEHGSKGRNGKDDTAKQCSGWIADEKTQECAYKCDLDPQDLRPDFLAFQNFLS